MKKLGIMGGTFNPIHNGHLQIARIAYQTAQLDKVIFLPDGEPPHKSAKSLASGISRFNMTVLALYGEKDFFASDLEIKRQGTTYTVDTLKELHGLYPNDRIYYIVGADTLFQIEHWYKPQLLGAYCSLIAVPRPGTDYIQLNKQAEHVRAVLGIEIILAFESGPEISSTDVRAKIGKGEKITDLTPQAVADYIYDHGLYNAAYSSATKQLFGSLSKHRFEHTLSVAETAVWLADRFNVNPIQAHKAGMLHDCAKGMDLPSLLKQIKSGNVEADDIELELPALLHAPAGAALAQAQYHIDDPAILSAIRWHTTGRRNMSDLEKVIYLADMIEPNRETFPGLEEIRLLAEKSLDDAVHASAAQSAAYVQSRGRKLHPKTLELAQEK